jgi:alkylation response protein AidB-like acyl-CoA dehydrogenase
LDFSYTDEQDLLRNSVRSFLSDHYSFAARRAAQNSGEAWRRDIWRAFARDLGILNMSFPPRLGGLGADAVTTMVVMEELGRALVVEPYLEAVVVCGGLLSRLPGPRADDVLAQLGQGEVVVAFAAAEPTSRDAFNSVSTRAVREGAGWRVTGAKSVVTAAPWASHLLVTARTGGSVCEADGISLFLVDKSAQGITCADFPTIDGRRAADVSFDRVFVPSDGLLCPEGQALGLVDEVIDHAIAALCGEAIGVMNVLHRDTVDYTRQRRQFGQAIANFQVLQHRMVDMYMEIEMAQSATFLGTLKLGAGSLERALAASAAKVTVANACRFVGQNAIQLHGGMGMTDDLAVSHYFRRATVMERELGGVDFHLARHAALSRRESAAN